jgi:hypothetical protein
MVGMKRSVTMPTPWLGGLKWDIRTSNDPGAGTDQALTCTILRDDKPITSFSLEPGDTERLDRGGHDVLFGQVKGAWFDPNAGDVNLARVQDEHGVEFPNGIPGHMKLRLQVAGDDEWIKESVTVFGQIGELWRDAEGGVSEDFADGNPWTNLGTYSMKRWLSTDPGDAPFSYVDLLF